MKLVVLYLLLTQSVFANSQIYDLSVSIKQNGKLISSLRILLKEGQKGTVISNSKGEKFFLEVSAKAGELDLQKGILVNFTTGLIPQTGVRKILARGKVLSEGEPVTVLSPQLDNDDTEISIHARHK